MYTNRHIQLYQTSLTQSEKQEAKSLIQDFLLKKGFDSEMVNTKSFRSFIGQWFNGNTIPNYKLAPKQVISNQMEIILNEILKTKSVSLKMQIQEQNTQLLTIQELLENECTQILNF